MKELDFPKLRQTYEWDCGAKALENVLTYYGIEIREELIIKYAKTNPKDGTKIDRMIKTLKKFKLKFDAKNMTIKELKNYIDKKIPIIILLQAWNKKNINYSKDYYDGHWVVAIGYDKTKIFFEDPYSFKKTYLKNKDLKDRWHAKENRQKIMNFGIAVFGRKPKYNSKKAIPMH